MSKSERYIHIRNWDRFQHRDITRNRARGAAWIKSYTGQLDDEDYIALSWSDRGLLEALRLQYATNCGRGINDSTTNLQRLFGQRVLRVQLERLNQAGFIQFSASKLLETCQQKPRLEVDKDKEQPTDTPLATNGRSTETEQPTPEQVRQFITEVELKTL